MGKIKTVELISAQRNSLEKGYRTGLSHAFRIRCQMILLKSEQRTAAEMANIPGCCEVVVNNCLKRYVSEGIEGLRTRPGRGRKPVPDAEKDLPRVEVAVAANRQRISLAKAELEAELGKTRGSEIILYMCTGARTVALGYSATSHSQTMLTRLSLYHQGEKTGNGVSGEPFIYT